MQFWKYVLNIAKQSSNILWMLPCFTSYSINNCKFIVNEIVKSCLIILPRQIGLIEKCLNRCCLKSIWTTFDYWKAIFCYCEWLSMIFFNFVHMRLLHENISQCSVYFYILHLCIYSLSCFTSIFILFCSEEDI